ncbi:MAG: AsnC family transcriptional regulator [Mucilaginibacter sp.]|nr:AsnC family transcriptional regulator [Mucilaginibacter sp.]
MLNGHPDEIDLKIMQLLQENARLDVMEVVRRVNLTKTPVTKRIRKLKEMGFIKSYVALLDREKIGQPVLVVTHVKLDKQTTAQLDAFEAMAKAMPEVQFCLHVSGGWNFILHITAATPQAYFHFIMEKITGMDNVAHVESCFVMKECKSYGSFVLYNWKNYF